MTRQQEFDMAGAIIIGNARFLANEFTRRGITNDSETIRGAFAEIIHLDDKRTGLLKEMIRETHE